MPAIDILMPDGTWQRGRTDAQDVANFIGTGADVYDTAGNKLTLVFFNSLNDLNVSKYNPGVWNIVVPGGTGPQGSIPLADYLAGSIPQPAVTPTTSGGMMPVTAWTATATAETPGTVPPLIEGGVIEHAPAQSSLPLLALGAILLLAFSRRSSK